MKPQKIKLLTILLLLLPLSLALLGLGAGCEENEHNSQCYQGMVVILNQGAGCQNIMKISESAENGQLVKNATISFNPDLYDGTLKVGDVKYFKVLEYEEFGNHISTQPCTFPQFAASIEFCNN